LREYIENWHDRPEVKKGDFAEEIVHGFLERKGFIVYSPQTEGPHGFDRLAVKNKQQVVIAEIKAKARMKKYRCTGINIKSYNEYKYIEQKHNIPVFIFFVDEWMGKIYGNILSELEKEVITDRTYPNTNIKPGIIFFSLKNMKVISELNADQIRYLKDHSTRNYSY